MDQIFETCGQTIVSAFPSIREAFSSITSSFSVESRRFIGMILLEHLLIGIKILFMGLVDDIPKAIRKQYLQVIRVSVHCNPNRLSDTA